MFLRTRVKVCGVTREKDAEYAVNAGADAIGLVFYAPSPRAVTVQQAAQIGQTIPAFVCKTALFVNPAQAEVETVLAQVPIDLLQFHGDESPAFCEQFKCSYIKAVRMQEDTDLHALADAYKTASGLLLDAYVSGVPGGTGQAFNWQWIPQNLSLPVILAGGLTEQNVQQAIQEVSPWAVDVSGGVEASKGIKSAAKIEQFLKNVMSD